MYFESEEITLKDGRKCILKCGGAEDAEGMIEYLKITSGETEFILRYPDEVNYTVEKERELLEDMKSHPYDAMIVAVVDGEIAGNCGVTAMGWKRKLRHRAGFGIALIGKYWNLGIGNALMKKSIELARQMGYEQMELEVVTENKRAIHLYEKYGYVIYGERPNGLKRDNGSYYNEYQMILKL